MNPLHLIWIVPLSGTLGVFAMAWCAANATSRMRDRIHALSVALGDLVQATTNDARFRDSFAIKNSVRRARKVLAVIAVREVES